MTRASRHSTCALVARMAVIIVLTVLVLAGRAAWAEDADRHALALDLARVMVDDQMRQGLVDQVGIGMLQLLGTRLQERLNRRLQESEVQALVESIRGFVNRTLTESRIEELAAGVYESYFDAAELKTMIDFQRSDVGRKAARLTPVIGRETSRAIETEIAQSPALSQLMAELGREFPVLRVPQSP